MKKFGLPTLPRPGAREATTPARPSDAKPAPTKAAAKSAARPLVMTKRQLSRYERERRIRRWLYIGAAAVIAVVLLVPAFGFWHEYYYRPGEPVAEVAGKPITLETFAKALAYQNAQISSQEQQVMAMAQKETEPAVKRMMSSQIQQLEQQRSSLEGQTVSTLVDAELIRQEAARRGITATPEEINQAIVDQFGPPAPPDPNNPNAKPAGTNQPNAEPATPATPTLTPAERSDQAQTALKAMLASVKVLSEDEFKRLVIEPQVLRKKLSDAMAAEVPTTAEQIHARHILVATEDEAKKVYERVTTGGESFEQVAAEVSIDTANKKQGGDLSWFPRGTMVPEFEQVAFSLEPGQISKPVKSSFGWHIIKVEGKEQNRPLTDKQLQKAKDAALPNWLTDQKKADKGIVKFEYDTSKIDWARNYLKRNKVA